MQAVNGKDWHTKVLSHQLNRLQTSIFILAVCAKRVEPNEADRRRNPTVSGASSFGYNCAMQVVFHNMRILYLPYSREIVNDLLPEECNQTYLLLSFQIVSTSKITHKC